MNPGTTASLICPACGQAFLSMQQGMEGMVQCPHCAHNALRGYFGTHAQVAGVAQVRRRVSQTQPLQNVQPVAFQPPQNPSAFPSQLTAWPGAPPMPVQTPSASIARATLQPSQALMPTGAPPPQAEELGPPPHLRTSPWRGAFILLAFTVVCGGAVWVWWDQVNAPVAKPATSTAPPPVQPQIRKAPTVPPTAIKLVSAPPPDVAEVSADVKALVTELFAADTPERRAACIHDAGKYGAEIEAQFGGEKKPELRLLSRIPGMPLILPGGQPVILFKLVTSVCPLGALVRLEPGADGKRRIHGPLLLETHAAKLPAFLNQTTDEAAWFYVGLRPSHGLDIPAELRTKYLTFDVQVSGGSDPHFVACVERDTPLGRFMDRETEWGKACVARLLLRRLDIQGDAPCLLVIDCEGAQEGGEGR